MSDFANINGYIDQLGSDIDLLHAFVNNGTASTVTLGGVATPTIRNLVSQIVAAGGAIAYQTLSALNADLNHAANSLAFVTNDSTNNGWYIKIGASGSGSWHKSSYDRTVTQDQITQCLKGAGGSFVTASNYSTTLGVSDLDQLTENKIYCFATSTISDIANMPPATESGGFLLVVLGQKVQRNGIIQMAIYPSGTMQIRGCWNTQYAWSEWTTHATRRDIESSVYFDDVFSIFKKVVCCGDSYTSGHIYTDESGATYTNELFAWPHYMHLLTGQTYVNCGKSGASVLSWLTDARGLQAARTSGKSPAYILGFGLNDSGSVNASAQISVGSVSDMSSNSPSTYYGAYGKALRDLDSISPGSFKFILTAPNPSSAVQPYNAAVRTIAAQYKNSYNVHVIDLENYGYAYNSAVLVSDKNHAHYTALGYKIFANILLKAISDYMIKNPTLFRNVFLLEAE